MNTRIDKLFADYAEHHRTVGNQWCHLIGIPLIAAGALGLLAIPLVHVGESPVDVSLLLIVVLAPAYLWLDPRLGVALTLAYVVIYLGARLLSWPVALGLFVVGWTFQFIGHGLYEKRSPAFFRNFVHLLVGPLWVVNHLLGLRPTARSTPS